MQNSDFPNLPNSWQVKTLGEVCDILDNMRKPINATEREQRLKNSTHKYAYYGATGQVGYIDDFLCDFESILLGEDGAPFLEPFKDKAYIVSGKYWVNNHAHILTAKQNFAINKFVCYFLNIVDYMPYVSGTTRLKLNQSAMKQIKIPIPPLEIQRRIVKRLDEAFSRIENGTKHLKSAKDNITKYKQSLLKSAFNGTLTNDSPLSQGESIAESSLRGSEATEAIHTLARHCETSQRLGVAIHTKNTNSTTPSLRGSEANEAIHKKEIDCHESANADSRNDDKDSLNSESANLPQGWTIKTLGEVCEFAYGKGLKSAKRNINGKYPVYAANGIKDYSDECMIKEPSIIVGRKGSVGSLVLTNAPCWVLDVSYYVVFDREKYDLMFLYHLLKTLNLNQYARGVKPGLSRSQAYELKVKIPPLETQRQIVAILERHFISADKVSAYIESCLSKAKQLKSSLLKSAFDGTLTNETTHPLAPSAREGEEVDCYESLCDSHNEDKAK